MSDTAGKKNNATKTRKTITANKTRSATARDAANPTLPSADDLKDRFKTGSVPTETDFKDLIDLANAGAEATGQTPGQTGAGAGMRLSETGQLEPNLESHDFTANGSDFCPGIVNTTTNEIGIDLYNGLEYVAEHGLDIKQGNGITIDTNGVNVKAGDGINVDADGVNVKAGDGITVDTNGVNVKAGKGIDIDSYGININLKANTGLRIDSNGYLEPTGIEYYDFRNDPTGCSPVMVDSHTNKIVVDLYRGLKHEEDHGLTVKLAEKGGIAFNDADELHLINPIGYGYATLPAGMVTAFHGTELPEGWALCDGENNTPDLRTMFIPTSKDNTKNSDSEKPEAFQLVYIIKK